MADTCVCRCPRVNHQHYRNGTDCSTCGCLVDRRHRPGGTGGEHAPPRRTAHLSRRHRVRWDRSPPLGTWHPHGRRRVHRPRRLPPRRLRERLQKVSAPGERPPAASSGNPCWPSPATTTTPSGSSPTWTTTCPLTRAFPPCRRRSPGPSPTGGRRMTVPGPSRSGTRLPCRSSSCGRTWPDRTASCARLPTRRPSRWAVALAVADAVLFTVALGAITAPHPAPAVTFEPPGPSSQTTTAGGRGQPVTTATIAATGGPRSGPATSQVGGLPHRTPAVTPPARSTAPAGSPPSTATSHAPTLAAPAPVVPVLSPAPVPPRQPRHLRRAGPWAAPAGPRSSWATGAVGCAARSGRSAGYGRHHRIG